MTEGDRICPYCIKPMWPQEQRQHGEWKWFYCDKCDIDVQIKERRK